MKKYLAVALIFLMGEAFAVVPEDLSEAKVLVVGQCVIEETAVPCAEVELKGKVYTVYFNWKGDLILIFSVKDGATKPYGVDDQQLEWNREAI